MKLRNLSILDNRKPVTQPFLYSGAMLRIYPHLSICEGSIYHLPQSCSKIHIICYINKEDLTVSYFWSLFLRGWQSVCGAIDRLVPCLFVVSLLRSCHGDLVLQALNETT